MERRRLLWTVVLALLLGLLFSPRITPSPPKAPGPALLPVAAAPRVRTPVRPAPPPMVRTLVAPTVVPPPPVQPAPAPAVAEAPTTEEPAVGWISGHVVDNNGVGVGGAVLHMHGPSGVLAHRIADDGEFHLSVPVGTWTVEAGWFDGEDEWRSAPATAYIHAGAIATLALEILLEGAGHAVHARLEEAIGMGWEVTRDDGLLQAGDVLIEVGGDLLVDMQPEAVRASLRERPGETVNVLVLRPSRNGTYQEIRLALEAR